MWLWAFFHGAMIMVGPIILVAYFLIRFSDKLPYIGDLDLQKESSSILFTVQSGALGSLFSPIIMAWHNEGVIIAFAMTASALILSLAISKPFSTLIGYSGDDKIQQNPGVSFTSGVIGLLLIVPIGFFRPE